MTATKPPNVLYASDRRRLERRAARLREARTLLREAIREANNRGASLREIADVVDMSHTGVAKWLRENDG